MTLLHLQPEPPETFVVSCLRCGCPRLTNRTETGQLTLRECPVCGYLGWRDVGDGLRARPTVVAP